MRFSLRWLFIAILFVAIGVVALLKANVWWASAARSAVFMLLSLGVVFALLTSGVQRAFWLGLAVVGWIHFASMGFGNQQTDYLLTDQCIKWLHTSVERDVLVQSGKDIRTIKRPANYVFIMVGRCISTALLAGLGGYAAASFYSRRNPRSVRLNRMSDNVTDHM